MGRLIRRLVALLFVPALCSLALARRPVPVIPAGTPINVRLTDNLSSETNQAGQTFRGTLETPVAVNGQIVFPKAAHVRGRIVRAHSSGRLSDPGILELSLTSIAGMPVSVRAIVIQGESHTKNNVGKIGGGAAAGGILGAVFGGGKGAAIGVGAGAAGGTVAAAATGKKPAVIESEAVLTWVTTQNLEPDRTVAVNNLPNGRNDAGYAYRSRRHDDEEDEDDDEDDDHGRDDARYYFSEQDRSMISTCVYGSRSGLPPGLAKKDRLPPGLEKHLRRNGTLPPGLQKRVRPLPYACESRLPRLPRDWSRVVLSGRIILMDGRSRIIDLFVAANY